MSPFQGNGAFLIGAFEGDGRKSGESMGESMGNQ